ncbi:AMP-binding protein [Granulicoccus phenolivorans]|uniref:AMP-binding protein n=1 Tax=Granulicoccus phenolivorans TaxID=266854 RepID=UPI00040485B7|nr:AMP-binding protein [Granulicoccus phenolivorans]
MPALSLLPATDPGLPGALRRALRADFVLAPLPPQPDPVVAMLQPQYPVTEPDAALIVATSGSTGTPKGVVLSAEAITAGVHATHTALGGPGHWTLAVPAHYVAGIMVIARTLVAETALLRVDAHLSARPDLPAGRNYLSLVPTQLVRALTEPATTAWLAGFDAILVGGAALAPAVRAAATAAGLRIVTTYGSSETSGGCVYDGIPLPGVEVTLAGQPAGAATAEPGRIDLAGPMIFAGYRLQPELTAEALIAPHRLHTQDRGAWVDGRLQILGRVDDVVISGGVNVDLAAVERAVREVLPEAVVIGVPDAEWGTRVVLAAVDPPPLRELQERLTGLEPAALPRRVLAVARMPLTSSGKVDRQQLIAHAQEVS